jgi:hypothetical protein
MREQIRGRASTRVLELERTSPRDLETIFVRGTTPDLDDLVDWQFRGVNAPDWARLAGIKKFVKGFYRDDARAGVYGYNCPVVQDGLARPWTTLPDDNAPKRFGFYRVAAVDPSSRDNAYLHAVLLDYGKGGNKLWDPSRGLRDYLVQIDPGDRDRYLGKAYYALGPLRVATSFFILERHRRAP